MTRIEDLRFDGRQVESFEYIDEVGITYAFRRFTIERLSDGEIWPHASSPEQLLYMVATAEKDIAGDFSDAVRNSVRDGYIETFDEAIYSRPLVIVEPALPEGITYQDAYRLIQAVHTLSWDDHILVVGLTNNNLFDAAVYRATGLKGAYRIGTTATAASLSTIRL